MRKIRTVMSVIAVGAAVFVSGAPSAMAADSESVPASAAAAPAGASYQHAQYTPQNQGSGAVSPRGTYPTGCGLTVLSFQSGLDAVGSATSACPMNVDRIQHTVHLYRSRWYGWESLASNTTGDNATYTAATTVDWYCGGKGTYTYRVEGFGQINFSGQTWNADAYDEARYSC